jgi:DinB superfamily
MSTEASAGAPPPVPGDTKDWTWVLDRPCPDCGFDGRRYGPERYAAEVRRIGVRWQQVLATDPDRLRQRPRPDWWSTLEYGCHVRDVFDIFHQRVELMLDTDGVAFANWDQDATAVADRYDRADPAEVAAAVGSNADRMAAVFDAVPDDGWPRVGVRSDGARFTVETLGRYLLHDPIHHLYDVGGRLGYDPAG